MTLLAFLLIAAVGGVLALLYALVRERANSLRIDGQLDELRKYGVSVKKEADALRAQNARLARWTSVANADDEAKRILRAATDASNEASRDARILTEGTEAQCQEMTAAARSEAKSIVGEAKAKASLIESEAMSALAAANRRSQEIVARAEADAQRIAGKAFDAVKNADRYTRIADAMRNRIEGYGDQYLVASSSLLDELAEEFSHRDAGKQLKLARDQSDDIVANGGASVCDYVEADRKEKAVRFVLDAFNGRAESILARAKHDNYGKLSKELDDAFELVNFNGSAFRNARITSTYLESKRNELRWASVAQELRRLEAEEQRRIREQMREEEKARREFEKAIKEAAKEEEAIRTAMVKAEAKIAEATESQRAKFEAQLAELTQRLADAEQRGQRALSMAQQTKRGFVYIISNVGSFGDGVYKIGLTRRLDPMDRIWELGDASVPFDFDVHAMIFSEDAPGLETKLHRHFVLNQVNKVNHRKEFFRTSVSDLKREIETMGIEAQWTLASEAREYRETQAIEELIREDGAAREAWVNRQLVLDPVDKLESTRLDDDLAVAAARVAGPGGERATDAAVAAVPGP